MEEERIEAVKDWPESKSVRDIQVFLGFANFYRRFIQNFSRIAALLTLILQTTDDETLSTQAIESKKNQDTPTSTGGGDGVNRDTKNLSSVVKSAKSKKPNFAKANSETDFLTPGAKKAFIYLRNAFTKAPIFRHFELKCHIRSEIDASKYAIGRVLSQITLYQHSSGHMSHEDPNSEFLKSKIGQWHPVAFFSRKMISAETRYKTLDQELLAIVEAFKTWRHYLKGCKYEVLVLTNHNNYYQFIDTKNLSSRQVR